MIKSYSYQFLWRLVSFILVCFFSWSNAFAQNNNIRRVEYYLNTDPGIGKGINVSVTSGAEVDVNFEIDVSGLKPGFNLLGFRGYNGKGWTQTYTRMIVIPHTGNTIEKLEYFWDKDPGVGLATSYPYSASGEAIVDIDIPYEGISPGIHVFGIRALSGGVWSQTHLNSVAVAATGNSVDAVEYFWDTDPGIGNATPYSCNAEGEIIIGFDALCEDLSFGIHTFGLRARSGGIWSQTYLHSIAIAPPDLPIEKIEYYWDDPVGEATELVFTQLDGYAQVDFNGIPTDELSIGSHTLFIRAMAGEKWSQFFTQKFFINGNPDFSISKETGCVGEELTFTNLTTEYAEGTLFIWDMGDGSEPITATGTELKYTYTAPGDYTVTLTSKLGDDGVNICKKDISVLSVENPTVKLTPENGLFCPGHEAIFTAISENVGETPVYTWYLNGTIVEGEITDTYTLATPQEGDIVKVIVETSNLCSNLDMVEAELTIAADVLPEVTLAHYFPVYNSEKAFTLTGGLPASGQYYVNGAEATQFVPSANALGEYTVTYRVTNSNGCYNEASQTFTLLDGSTLSGDINKDGVVDIYDVLCAVNIMYGIIYPTYNMTTADLNGDGIINVEDLVGIVGIITSPYGGTRSSSWPSSMNTRNGLIVNNAAGSPGSVVRTSVSLDAEAWISGAQFDITLPEGVIAESASKDVVVGRKPNTDSNTYMILSYSMSLGKLQEKLMLDLILPEGMMPGDYRIEIANSVLADRNMKNVITRAESGTLQIVPTGINQPEDTSIQVISGNKCIEVFHASGAAITVYDMAGRLISTIRKAEDVERISVQAGMYIVKVVAEGRVNEFKVMIK